MYLPKAFEEDRLPILHEAIRSCGLATLVTVTASGPVASHIPMLLDAGPARSTLWRCRQCPGPTRPRR